jgi:hypothetical protein
MLPKQGRALLVVLMLTPIILSMTGCPSTSANGGTSSPSILSVESIEFPTFNDLGDASIQVLQNSDTAVAYAWPDREDSTDTDWEEKDAYDLVSNINSDGGTMNLGGLKE